MNKPANTDHVMRSNGKTLGDDRDGIYFLRLRMINEERTRYALELRNTKAPAWAA